MFVYINPFFVGSGGLYPLKQEHCKAGQYTPEGLYQKMGAKFRLVICVISFHYSTFVCLDVSEDEVDCCVVISSWSFDCLSTVQFVGHDLVCICCRRSRSALLETFGDLYIKTMTTSGLCCTLKTVASTSLVSNVKPSKTLLLHIVSVW